MYSIIIQCIILENKSSSFDFIFCPNNNQKKNVSITVISIDHVNLKNYLYRLNCALI